MTADYADTPGNRGYLQADAGELTATIIAAHPAGWQVAAHAIGDRAIDVVLEAYERPRHASLAPAPGTGSSTSRPPARTRSAGPPGWA